MGNVLSAVNTPKKAHNSLIPPTILYILLSSSQNETENKKMKLIPKRFSRSSSSLSSSNGVEEVHWELRPGGLLVQKRHHSSSSSFCEDIIKLRVSTTSTSHDISIEATSTFGELKVILSLVTNLKPKEQRLLFKGKEREDGDYLHMVGVGNMDKVLLLEDPAITEKKLHASATRKSYSYY